VRVVIPEVGKGFGLQLGFGHSWASVIGVQGRTTEWDMQKNEGGMQGKPTEWHMQGDTGWHFQIFPFLFDKPMCTIYTKAR